MKTHLLWFDDRTNTPIADKLQRAAAHFEAKHGQRPTICAINPLMAAAAGLQGPAVIAGMQIKTSQNVLTNHFWLGVEAEPEQEPAA